MDTRRERVTRAMKIHYGITTYDGTTPTGAQHDSRIEESVSENGTRCTFHFEQAVRSAAVSCTFEFEDWTKENYVFVPAAVYDGNRYPAYPCDYPPMLAPSDRSASIPTTITDVPHLSVDSPRSRIQLTTGDAATPCMGFYDRRARRGVLIHTKQRTPLGNTGMTIEEDLDTGVARFILRAPALREQWMYSFGGSQETPEGEVPVQVMEGESIGWKFGTHITPSDDVAHDFVAGEHVSLDFKVDVFPAESIHAFFDRFFRTRKDFETTRSDFHGVPFSTAFALIEEKYNRENWKPEYGYYAVGTVDGRYQDFQTGWVGGGMSTEPLMTKGLALSRTRALSTLDFIVSTMQNELGWYGGVFYKGEQYGDDFSTEPGGSVLLIRKHCDMVYFLLRQYEHMKPDGTGRRARVKQSILTACDALVRLWKKYGQFGQLIDRTAETVVVGGSACAGLAPAALILAYTRFGRKAYLQVARESADDFHRRFVETGFINGGPGEILQCADSESADALLESFVALYLATADEKYLRFARNTAAQCSSWCMSYDSVFPRTSCFGTLGIHTTGSVFANIQNKHSAPGHCTLAGEGLLSLYRVTGDIHYLDLLRDTAHGITQYVACPSNPIWDYNGNPLPSGYICERVNTSDWESKACVGGVFAGSCWPEVSCMLTYSCLPSVYVNTRYDTMTVFDHLEVTRDPGSGRLELRNPTDHDAVYTVRIDDGTTFREIGMALASGHRAAVEMQGEVVR